MSAREHSTRPPSARTVQFLTIRENFDKILVRFMRQGLESFVVVDAQVLVRCIHFHRVVSKVATTREQGPVHALAHTTELQPAGGNLAIAQDTRSDLEIRETAKDTTGQRLEIVVI